VFLLQDLEIQHLFPKIILLNLEDDPLEDSVPGGYFSVSRYPSKGNVGS
jgi:hypothetical protein